MPHKVTERVHATWRDAHYTVRKVDVMTYFEMEPDEFKAYMAERVAMYAAILDDASKYGCVALWKVGSPIHHYVHPSPSMDAWQVTCWDEWGPVGHQNITTPQQLEREINEFDLHVYSLVA